MNTTFESPDEFKARCDAIDGKIKRYKNSIAQHEETILQIEGQSNKAEEVRSRKQKIQAAKEKIERVSADFSIREKNTKAEETKLLLDFFDKCLEDIGSELRVIRDEETE